MIFKRDILYEFINFKFFMRDSSNATINSVCCADTPPN